MNAQTNIIAAGGMLALTVDRKALADALASMKATGARIIEARNNIPILGCVRLDATPDKLTLTGTDLDLALVVEMPAATDGTGSIAIEFEALLRAAKAAKGETVRLVDMGGADAKKNGVATLQHDGGTARLSTRLPDDFPIMAMPDGIERFSIDPAAFAGDLDRLAPCISTEETRYYLNGVFFHTPDADGTGAKRFRMAATDGHRMGRIDRDLPEGMPTEFPDSIVPRKAIEWIRRKGLKGAATCSIGFTGSRFVFQAGRVRLISKLIDGTFPDYARVIPAPASVWGNAHVIAVDADALGAAAKQVSAHMTERTRAFTLSAGDGWASAFATCVENGAASTLIEGTEFTAKPDKDGQPVDSFAIGFNAKYVGEMMAAFKGARITLETCDAGAPARIESPDVPEFLAVLMPMHTDCEPKSPEALRKMNRDACEIFCEDMRGKLEAVAKLEAECADPETGDNTYLRDALALARKNAGAIVTAAIDLMAARTGWPRYAARATILRDLGDMRGTGDPVEARAAAAKAKAAPISAETCGPIYGGTAGQPAAVYFMDELPEPEPVDEGQAPAVEPEPCQPDEPSPETPDAPAQADEPSAPMFASLQEFKAAAGQGSRWIIESFDPDSGAWVRPRARTVATVRARDIGFIGGEATLDECREADVRGGGGRSWVGFPKQDGWQSDAEGLVILSGLSPETRGPNIRLRPAPAPVEPVQDAPAGQPDELATLRAMVLDLAAKVEALQSAGVPVEGESQPSAPVAPVDAPEAPVRRTEGHERAIRRAMSYRQLARRHGAARDRLEGDVRDAKHAALHAGLERDEAIERATLAEEAVETAHRRVGALEGMVDKLKRRCARLKAVLLGRNAQIETLGRDLMIARNRASELRAAGETPRPAAVRIMEDAA